MTAIAAPSGRPIIVAMATALRLTRNDKPIISSNSGLNWPIKSKANAKDVLKFCIIYEYCIIFVNYAILVAK